MARGGNGLSWALWIIAIVALIFLLREASGLLIPIVLAVLISYALEPVVAWLAYHGLPRLAATSLLMLLFFGGAGWTAYGLRDDVLQAFESVPTVVERVRGFVWSGESAPGLRVQRAAEALQGGGSSNSSERGEEAAAREAATTAAHKAGPPATPASRRQAKPSGDGFRAPSVR